MYLKKIIARNLPDKPLRALQRDLASNRTVASLTQHVRLSACLCESVVRFVHVRRLRNEARFYKEVAPILRSKGVPLVQALVLEERLQAVDAVEDGLNEVGWRVSVFQLWCCGEDERLMHV